MTGSKYYSIAESMHLAVEALPVTPELLLVDGNRFNAYPFIPHQCFVKGDGTYASIAAASVLLKHTGTIFTTTAYTIPRIMAGIGIKVMVHRTTAKLLQHMDCVSGTERVSGLAGSC